jgi:hypothetical protein
MADLLLARSCQPVDGGRSVARHGPSISTRTSLTTVPIWTATAPSARLLQALRDSINPQTCQHAVLPSIDVQQARNHWQTKHDNDAQHRGDGHGRQDVLSLRAYRGRHRCNR